MSNPSRLWRAQLPAQLASRWSRSDGGSGSGLTHVGTAALLVAYVPISKAGIGGDDFHETMRGVSRQMDFVQALPDADALLSAVQSRRLCSQIDFAARSVFGLLVHEPRPEIHCQIVRAHMAGSSEGLVGLVWYHDTLRI
jgi:hypothetical protein